MKAASIGLPAVRSDVSVVETGHPRYPWALVDPVQQTQLGLDPIGKVVVDALSEPRSALEVLGHAHKVGEDRLDPTLLRRHVRHLSRHGMLEGKRAEQLRAVPDITDDPSDVAELPMDYAQGLQHACQACGSCCSATDVGPIEPEVAAEIQAHDWDIEGGLFRSGTHDEADVVLTSMRNDQCVFLGGDKLCQIHGRLGVERKPAPCRQFPFVFARASGRIAVSIQMECRAYWRAKQAAAPPSEHESDLRELLQIGARVHAVPSRVQVDAGLHIGRDEYLRLESAIIAAVRDSASEGSMYDPINAFARAAHVALRGIYDSVDAEERAYVGSQRWSAAFPGHFPDDPDPWENFLAHLERFQQEVLGFMQKASEVAAQRQLPWLAQRFKVLGQSIHAACGAIEPTSFRCVDPEAARTILEDVIISALFAKEAVRRGTTLRLGLALIGLRALMTLAGACDRAKEACRVEVLTQDLIDTMVTISKMLREKSVADLLGGLENTLIALFLTNLEVFGQTGTPALEAPGGIP